MKKITEYEKKQCAKCKYRTTLETKAVCNFLEITGNRRPSPVGEPCQEYEKGKPLAPMKKQKTRNYPKEVKNPPTKHKQRIYSEMTEEQKEMRRAATRRYREKKKREQNEQS